MRATRAYITSFGTTGLLIAAALLSLSVVSAFVAFNGFPGQDVQDPIGTLLVPVRQATVTVPARPLRSRAFSGRQSGGATFRAVARSRRGTGPVAHATPVVQSTPSTQPSGAPAPASSQGQQPASGPVGSISPPLTQGGTPTLPSTSVPQVTLPPLPDPQQTQLPVDTNTVTGVLGSP